MRYLLSLVFVGICASAWSQTTPSGVSPERISESPELRVTVEHIQYIGDHDLIVHFSFLNKPITSCSSFRGIPNGRR